MSEIRKLPERDADTKWPLHADIRNDTDALISDTIVSLYWLDSFKHNKTFEHSVLFEDFVQRPSPPVSGLVIWLSDVAPPFHG